MKLSVQHLRDAIDAWHRDEARERVARWSGDVDAGSPLSVIRRHAWLWSPGAQEALAEAVGERQLSPASQAAIEAQLAAALGRRAWLEMTDGKLRAPVLLRGREVALPKAWADLVSTEDRVERAAIARALSEHAANSAGLVHEARAFSAERARRFVASASDAALVKACIEDAQRFLHDTEDATREHVRHLTRSITRGESPAWHDVLFALRDRNFDGLVRKATRMRRLAEPLRGLGFDRELASHVRVESVANATLPYARLARVDTPTDIRIGIPQQDWGVLSELSAFGALARALAYALSSRALPIERRRSVHGSVPRVWSTLFGQCLADRAFLTRTFGWSAREVETVARRNAVTLLLNARRSATLVCLDAHGLSDHDRNHENATSAWASEVPFALFSGAVPGSERVREQWWGQCVGLAAAAAFRERFDVDWYRNPRVAEPLRGAAARAGELSATTWLDELGGASDASSARILELLH